jgi:C-terminal processing protease CtpA/Prc
MATSTLMSPEEAAEEKYGVGIYFGQDIDKQVFVEALMPGGSAALARAVKAKDILLKVSRLSFKMARMTPQLQE